MLPNVFYPTYRYPNRIIPRNERSKNDHYAVPNLLSRPLFYFATRNAHAPISRFANEEIPWKIWKISLATMHFLTLSPLRITSSWTSLLLYYNYTSTLKCETQRQQRLKTETKTLLRNVLRTPALVYPQISKWILPRNLMRIWKRRNILIIPKMKTFEPRCEKSIFLSRRRNPISSR